MSELVMLAASFRPLPMIHSVASDELAIADPQPNVLNLASTILPSSSTCGERRAPHGAVNTGGS